MKKTILLLMAMTISVLSFAKKKPSKYYELRVYYCHPGKLPNLITRFTDHTTKLFEKHGMENIGYWTPTTADNNVLYYVLGYPSKEARDASWKAFGADPEWKEVAKKSEESGKIVAKVESKFMTLHPELTKKIKFQQANPERLFEMRTYYCLPGRYPNIVARFRDHTRKLFEKHGMENVMYFETIEKDGGQATLLYFLAHKDADAAKKSWDGFRADPNWIKVRDASEESGKIVEKVESVFMKPAGFSRIK
ncbi:NIPSNAP family protein [Lacihabitans soyangensis]|uniref:NIPSNAP family protein n=1 Tax=Lacihabitans soyangensis TaxID=869394 RepID=A0AAE3GYV9_9BACT|nr:NIPSNAP family protein [Lacihabitans soyangensis]MCP9761839.1 NIPSNAP family protein [Lacihabitans soyangensis]